MSVNRARSAATACAVLDVVAPGTERVSRRRPLLGADDREVLVDEDMVRPVGADGVDVVLAVTQLHDTVDDSSPVGGQSPNAQQRSAVTRFPLRCHI
jgi:hypothetical protein